MKYWKEKHLCLFKNLFLTPFSFFCPLPTVHKLKCRLHIHIHAELQNKKRKVRIFILSICLTIRTLGKKYFLPKQKNNLLNNKHCYLHYEEIIESHMLLLTCTCSFSNLHLSSDRVTWAVKDSFDPFSVCSSVVHTQRSCSQALCNSRSSQTQ